MKKAEVQDFWAAGIKVKTERFPEGSKSKNGECSEKPKDFDLEEVGLLNDRKLAKKGLTVRGGGAIIINVVARTANELSE